LFFISFIQSIGGWVPIFLFVGLVLAETKDEEELPPCCHLQQLPPPQATTTNGEGD
jgi:hypothetical protein